MIICDDTIFLPWTPSFNEITVIFHNASNYHYHFIVNELANKVKSQFECLGKNTKKYKMFSFSIDKEIRKVNKDSNEDIRATSYKTKLIDGARFWASSLSNFFDSFKEGIHKFKRKDCNCFYEYESVNDNIIRYNCIYCNKTINQKNHSVIRLGFLIAMLIQRCLSLQL